MSLAMVLALTACGGSNSGGGSENNSAPDPEQTYHLVYSYFGPEVIPPGQFPKLAMEKITERSNGRLTFDAYFSGTLLSAADSVTGCMNKTADMVWVDSSQMSELFPLNNVFTMPYIETPPVKSKLDAAFQQMLIDCPELVAELAAKDLMYISMMAAGGFHLHGVKELFDSPSKLSGKIIDGLGFGGRLATALGANGVVIDVTDYYMSMSTGLLDGQFNHYASVHGFAVDEVVTTHTMFSNSNDLHDYDAMLGGGLYAAMMGIIMNKSSFDALPADLQALVVEEFGKIADYITPIDLEVMVKPSIELGESKGDKFIFIDDAGRQEWAHGIQQVVDEWVSDVGALGYDGRAIYNHMMDLFD